MSQYKTVLVAIDLSDESGQVALRAQAIARAGGCELHVIHVIDPRSKTALTPITSISCWGAQKWRFTPWPRKSALT